MAKKQSKNANVAARAKNKGTGKDYIKVVKSIKDPATGNYSFKEVMIHKDQVDAYLAAK